MLNLFEAVRANPGYSKLEIGDFLFAEYTCGVSAKKLPNWTDTDYLVHVVTGKKTWHTADGIWKAHPGETLFFKKGAAIVEQHFEEDVCLLMFFIPDGFVRSTVREMAGGPALAASGGALIKTALRVENDVALSAFFQSIQCQPTASARCFSSGFQRGGHGCHANGHVCLHGHRAEGGANRHRSREGAKTTQTESGRRNIIRCRRRINNSRSESFFSTRLTDARRTLCQIE